VSSPGREAFAARYGPAALVTGASTGIGAEFARQLAAHGLDLVLVARRLERLEEVANEVRAAHGVAVHVAVLDLGARDLRDRLCEAIRGIDVGLVVSNAGRYGFGRFLDARLEDELDGLGVNARAPLVLAHEFARRLAERGRGGMIFLSSSSAFQGTPFAAGYGAAKAHTLTLAEALAFELEPWGVDVLAVCPGPVATEGTADMDTSSFPIGPMQPAPVVRAALDALGRRTSIVPGLPNALVVQLGKLLPRSLNTRLMGAIFGRAFHLTRR
jgi:short-subunit dehydrogenase